MATWFSDNIDVELHRAQLVLKWVTAHADNYLIGYGS